MKLKISLIVNRENNKDYLLVYYNYKDIPNYIKEEYNFRNTIERDNEDFTYGCELCTKRYKLTLNKWVLIGLTGNKEVGDLIKK